MSIVAPPLGSKLRALLTELAHNRSAIADRSHDAVSRDSAIQADMDPGLRQDLREQIQLVVDLWFSALMTGGGLEEAAQQLAEIGRRRVHQGVPLSLLTQGLRLGMLEVWHIVLDVARRDNEIRDEMLFSLSPYLYSFVDQLSHGISVAYLDEQYRRERWREARDHELTRLILNSPDDESRFKRACDTLGIDPTGCRVALAMDIEMPDALPSHQGSRFDRLLLTIARHLKVNSDDLLHVMHRGRLVTWLPAMRGHSIVCTDQLMREAARSMAKLVPGVRAIGVGLVNRGASGWAASADEAFKAIDAGRHDTQGGNWFMYSDIALSASVLRPDSLLRYLDSLIERLTYESDLLPTLVAYFNHGQHRKLAAGALGIHPNTLNYRLDRIEEMLGADLSDSGWIARLDVAVTLRRLSGPTQLDESARGFYPALTTSQP